MDTPEWNLKYRRSHLLYNSIIYRLISPPALCRSYEKGIVTVKSKVTFPPSSQPF